MEWCEAMMTETIDRPFRMRLYLDRMTIRNPSDAATRAGHNDDVCPGFTADVN
jgi:hypothetical protein